MNLLPIQQIMHNYITHAGRIVVLMGKRFSMIVNSLLYASNRWYLFLKQVVWTFLYDRPRTSLIVEQCVRVGVASTPIIVLTGFSTGLAVGLQAYISFNRFGIHDFMGTIVALGMLREMGPVLTGLMITSRCGSAIAAEVATMRISEQLDALYTLRVSPYRYVILPRIIACVATLPLLSILASAAGMIGGYILCVYGFHINAHAYSSGMERFVTVIDIASGLLKALVFGFAIGIVSCFYGFFAQQGSEGVGIATTRSVALCSLLVLVLNYIVSTALVVLGAV